MLSLSNHPPDLLLSTLSLLSLCPLSTLSLPSLFPLSILSLPSLYPLSTLSLPSLYHLSTLSRTLSLPSLCPLSTISLPSLSPLSTLSRTLSLPLSTLSRTLSLPSLYHLSTLSLSPLSTLQSSYHAACAHVMEPVMDSSRLLCPDKVWEDISHRLYATFWSLSLYDLYVPASRYEDEISRAKQASKDVENNSDLVKGLYLIVSRCFLSPPFYLPLNLFFDSCSLESGFLKENTQLEIRKLNLFQKTNKFLLYLAFFTLPFLTFFTLPYLTLPYLALSYFTSQTSSKKKKEQERNNVLIEKLQDEKQRQQDNNRLVLSWLKKEKETWFYSSKSAKLNQLACVYLSVFLLQRFSRTGPSPSSSSSAYSHAADSQLPTLSTVPSLSTSFTPCTHLTSPPSSFWTE